MSPEQLNKLLKPHGLGVEEGKDGTLRVVGKALESLGEQQETDYYITCRHSVDITYRVPNTSFDEALSSLCNRELFQEHGEAMFGPDEWILRDIGAEIVETDCYSDPAPTGRQWSRRDWVFTEEPVYRDEYDEDMTA